MYLLLIHCLTLIIGFPWNLAHKHRHTDMYKGIKLYMYLYWFIYGFKSMIWI